MKRALLAVPILLLATGLWLARGAYSYFFSSSSFSAPYSGNPWSANDNYGSGRQLFWEGAPSGDREAKMTTNFDAAVAGTSALYVSAQRLFDAGTGTWQIGSCTCIFINNYGTGSTGNPVNGSITVYQTTSYWGAQWYTLYSTSLTFPETSTIRAVKRSGQLVLYVNDQYLVALTPPFSMSESPGLAVYDWSTPEIKNPALIEYGYIDSVPPNAIPSGNITKTAYSNHIDLQWPATSDDANGVGLLRYELYRGGSLLTTTTGLSFSDTASILPGQTYNYTLKVLDKHLSEVSTAFSVTTPAVQTSGPFPSATPEGRRVGVRPTGAYWGAGTENIDVMSGNLNFSLPLLAPQARGGWGASVALSYNSQNFRWDGGSGTNWHYGRDVGFGYGWRLMIGSITPVYSDPYTVTHYLFTDSSGAEYRLDQNASGTWTSKESLYIAYTPSNTRLTFKDGSFWEFGATSAAAEPDAGILYPTKLQDSNGNQIIIKYKTSPGAGWANSSARIDEIDDIRNLSPGSYTYKFTYNSDTPAHLTSIASNIGDAGTYTFTYLSNQSLSSPYNSAAYGSTNKFLQRVTNTFDSMYHEFTYNSSGEATLVRLPYGGKLGYDYVTTTYSTGTKHREVQYRKLYKDANGSTYTQYTFSHEASPGASTHAWTQLNDPGGVGRKYWEFGPSGVSWGLVTKYQGIHLNGGSATVKAQNDYTWSLDAAGKNSYISAVLKTNDPGQSYVATSKTEQTIDNNGNVTQVKTYDYGNLTTPLRTDNFTYSSLNRLTGGPNIAINYDGSTLQNSANAASYRLWDQSMLNVTTRGNPTYITGLGNVTSISYDIAGVQRSSSTNGIVSNATFNAAQQFAVPTAISISGTDAGNTTFGYDSRMNLTSTTTSNGATASSTRDAAGRPTSATSPFGAVTSMGYNLTYNAPNFSDVTTINGRSSQTIKDGLGRPITSIAPNGGISDTEYDSCGCSPTGKVKRTSLPHASGATPVWTTMTYDGIGRTLTSVTQGTETTSTTTYLYEGNTVKVTDAAGKWKKYTTNVLGQLTQVNEPNPAGGSDYVTNYTYTYLGNLSTVTMPRPTGTQTRSFTYSNGHILSATNPESGTTSYEYNSDYTPKRKTDAKGQRTEYSYDAYKRVTQTRRGTWGSINNILINASGGLPTSPAVPVTVAGNSIGTFTPNTTMARDYPLASTGSLGQIVITWNVFSNPNLAINSIIANGTTLCTSCQPSSYDGVTWTVTVSASGSGTGLIEDQCQREDFYYDSNPYDTGSPAFADNLKGRLSAVVYRGGWNGTTCDITFTEMYSYHDAGAITKKRLRVKRGTLANMDLDSTMTYDNEGRNTAIQYPSTWNSSTSTWDAGPNLGVEFNSTGQLNKLKNLTTSTDIISGATYNAMGELLTMTGVNGAPSETRAYNSIGQMTQLQSAGVNIQYNFSSTQNNGKIASETDVLSGETVTYAYDSLNRLASATSSVNPGWGQSFGYDGFGNLTTVNVTKGTAPSLSVSYNAATNRRTTDGADANGNIFQNGITAYDVENRIATASITNGTVRYSYAPGNKRVWRGTWVSGSQTVDELTYYSAGGVKLSAYTLSTDGTNLRAASTGYHEYFGGKLIKNATGYVGQDRLGSIGKFFPYGQERPSATTNGKEKFATYFRDSETGLDYADQRYHSSGDGRFLSPDPYQPSAGLDDPASWNRYAYAGGDPVNNHDPSGLFYSSATWGRGCFLDGINFGCEQLDLLFCGTQEWSLFKSVNACFDFWPEPYYEEQELPPVKIECQVEIGYISIGNTVRHSFFRLTTWSDGILASQQIIEAVDSPVDSSAPPGTDPTSSYLNMVTTGTGTTVPSPGIFQSQNYANATVMYNSGISTEACGTLGAVTSAASSYRNWTLPYHLTSGPNSNSFTHWLALKAGIEDSQIRLPRRQLGIGPRLVAWDKNNLIPF